jgi:peptidyl-prolyl cis-trans isomerase B (cyclophilin B)
MTSGAADSTELRGGVKRWRQPFRAAAIDASQGDAPPAGCERPADRTMTGKSTAKLLFAVKNAWDGIRLVNDAGQPLVFPVALETAEGPIELELHAAWAPNHVRNFIALAQAGYFDGLVFDRIVHQAIATETILPGSGNDGPLEVKLIEAGCPLGTGVPGYHSIGYWLRPEFNPELKHEAGTVGACRLEEEDTAACKFYISLERVPMLDGYTTVFGTVTQGLDVVRRIYHEPRFETEEDQGYHRPVKPVVIEKVVIHPPDVDRSESIAAHE